jgi:hypothetical protein
MDNVLVGEVPVELIPAPAGKFLMGSDNRFFAEAPGHPVTIAAGFLLGKLPVTQTQWRAVMRDNPSAFCDSPDQPVDSVSWDQATAFCRRLSDRFPLAAWPGVSGLRETGWDSLECLGHGLTCPVDGALCAADCRQVVLLLFGQPGRQLSQADLPRHQAGCNCQT